MAQKKGKADEISTKNTYINNQVNGGTHKENGVRQDMIARRGNL